MSFVEREKPQSKAEKLVIMGVGSTVVLGTMFLATIALCVPLALLCVKLEKNKSLNIILGG